jgi:hypothetical protein
MSGVERKMISIHPGSPYCQPLSLQLSTTHAAYKIPLAMPLELQFSYSTTAYYYLFFNNCLFVMKTTILTSFVAIALFAVRRSFAVVVRSQITFPGVSLSFALSMIMLLISLASE